MYISQTELYHLRDSVKNLANRVVHLPDSVKNLANRVVHLPDSVKNLANRVASRCDSVNNLEKQKKKINNFRANSDQSESLCDRVKLHCDSVKNAVTALTTLFGFCKNPIYAVTYGCHFTAVTAYSVTAQQLCHSVAKIGNLRCHSVNVPGVMFGLE